MYILCSIFLLTFFVSLFQFDCFYSPMFHFTMIKFSALSNVLWNPYATFSIRYLIFHFLNFHLMLSYRFQFSNEFFHNFKYFFLFFAFSGTYCYLNFFLLILMSELLFGLPLLSVAFSRLSVLLSYILTCLIIFYFMSINLLEKNHRCSRWCCIPREGIFFLLLGDRTELEIAVWGWNSLWCLQMIYFLSLSSFFLVVISRSIGFLLPNVFHLYWKSQVAILNKEWIIFHKMSGMLGIGN